jgi:hypothetical protein
LRDVLDQELQTAQEGYLVRIEAHTLVLDEKLDGMAEQLAAINALLQSQADAADAAAAAAAAAVEEESSSVGAFAVSDDGSRIYEHIRSSAGCADEPTAPFSAFVLAFETFFLAGTPMPRRVRRGLTFALDRELSGRVSSLQWTAFYLGWRRASLAMDDYLLQLGEDAPLDWTDTVKYAAEAVAGAAVAGLKDGFRSAQNKVCDPHSLIHSLTHSLTHLLVLLTGTHA